MKRKGRRDLPWTCQSVSGWWARTGVAIYRRLACERPESCRCHRERRPCHETRSCHRPPLRPRRCPQSTLHQIPSTHGKRHTYEKRSWYTCFLLSSLLCVSVLCVRLPCFLSLIPSRTRCEHITKTSRNHARDVWRASEGLKRLLVASKTFSRNWRRISTSLPSSLETSFSEISSEPSSELSRKFNESRVSPHLDLYTAVSAVAFRISSSFAALFSLLAAPPDEWAKPKRSRSSSHTRSSFLKVNVIRGEIRLLLI